MDERGETETRNSVLSREAGGCLFLLWFSSFAAGGGGQKGETQFAVSLRAAGLRKGRK